MTAEMQIGPSPELVVSPDNPHSLGKQLTGIAISSVLIIAASLIGGVIVSLAGIFTFLDAWHSGIYKTPGRRAITNMSPMGWGITMMWLFIITYPIYLLRRNRLKTKDGSNVFWYLLHVVAAILILLIALQVLVATSGGTA